MISQFKITEKHVYNACFFAISTSLALSLSVKGYPEKIFYWCSYISLIFLLFSAFKKTLRVDMFALLLSLSISLVGLIRLLWSLKFHGSEFSDVIGNYFIGGKRLILFGVLFYFFYAYRGFLTSLTLKCSFASFALGTIIVLALAYSEYHSGGGRIKLITDSAGTVSYLIVFVLFSTLFIASKISSNKYYLLLMFLCLFAINMVLLALTESRAALIVTPFLYIAFFILEYKWANKKHLLFIGFMAILSLSLMPSTVWHRLENIESEALSYQHDNNTSIGARFSIWKSGLHSVSWSLLGQSPDDRNNKARQYIETHERDNPEAYKNVIYHLHDDILETLSLQGIAGAVSLVLLFSLLIVLPVIRHQPVFAILPCSLVIFGLTDTVLIQSQSIVIVFISIIVTYTLMKE